MKKELILLSFMMILLSNDRLVCEVHELDPSVHDDVQSVDDELICYGEHETDCHPFVIKREEVKEFLEIVLHPVAVYIKNSKEILAQEMLAQAQIFLREKIGPSIITRLDPRYHVKKNKVAIPEIKDKDFKTILNKAVSAILIRKQRLSGLVGDSTKLIGSIWRSLSGLVGKPLLETLDLAREKCRYAINHGIANPTSGSVAKDREHCKEQAKAFINSHESKTIDNYKKCFEIAMSDNKADGKKVGRRDGLGNRGEIAHGDGTREKCSNGLKNGYYAESELDIFKPT